MISYLRKFVKPVFDKHPFFANCITYGSFTTSAEFIQQSIILYDESKREGNKKQSVSIKNFCDKLLNELLKPCNARKLIATNLNTGI